MAKKPAGNQGEKAGGLSASCRVVILYGDEGFLRTLHTSELRKALEKEYGEIDAHVFDGLSSQAADVLDECRSFGLIASHKLVIVDNAEAVVKEDNRPLFERYAQSPSEGATLVLRSGKWRPGNLDKMVAEVGAVVECKTPNEAACVAWMLKRAPAAHQAKIGEEAAGLLIQRTGADLAKLDMELAKLAAAAGAAKGAVAEITPAIVVMLVGMSREEEAWGVQQTFLAGSPEAAIAHLRHVLEVSRQPAPLVMWAVTDLARKLHAMTCAVHQKGNVNETAKRLRLWGPSQYAIQNAAAKLKPSQTMDFFRACVKADQRSKSGLTEPDRALEVLALKLTGSMGGARAGRQVP